MKKFYENQGVELVKMFTRAKAADVVTSLDMTLPDPDSESGQVDWKQMLGHFLPHVDIFLPSVEEIAFMLDRELFEQRKSEAGGNDPVLFYRAADCSALAEQLIDMGVGIAAIKNGIRGYYLRTAGKHRLESLANVIEYSPEQWSHRELWAGSYKTDRFGSATGAGDATIAGFLTAFLRGLAPADCLQVANTVGWQNIQCVDAVSGIADWQTTLEMLCDKTRQQNKLEINDSGWQWDADRKIFRGPADREKK
jgi:sugar/nucleoside kinase (ribokinase family)